MSLSNNDMKEESKYLNKTIAEVKSQLEVLENDINVKQSEILEFRKFLWEEKGSVDSVEMKTSLMNSEFEANFMLSKMEKFKRLLKAEDSPYFGRVDFKEENTELIKEVYIGLTNIDKDLDYYVYDWRSPIASLFYDYGIGKARYEAPEGTIKGDISIRRQYKIELGKMKRIFDNDLNVVDECLQEVLSTQSSDKMKNIVNTIQKEQNEIIRNIENKNLIVQGIAGSGKTSVALHRIAFLLYKIKNLKSSNVLIFSPNNVFSEYISNVLPELGEENALETTFHDFASTYVKEFKSVESFAHFIENYYNDNNINEKLIKFKLSRNMVSVLENYAREIENKIRVLDDIEVGVQNIDKKYLNYLLLDRYNRLPLFERFDKIAEHLCDKVGISYGKGKRSIIKKIKDNLNMEINTKTIYKNLYKSESFINEYGTSEEIKLNNKMINYEDALCFIYLKGLLKGFPYSNLIKQIVIDEAQDYNELQYIILSKIFKRASFTILGDVNQTINPYQKYESLEVLKDILNDNTKYIELNKTYRSSSEIIEFTNKVLGLKHVSAIRKPNMVPVVLRDSDSYLKDDINHLRDKYSSLAIITKNKTDALKLYDRLKEDFEDLSLLDDNTKKFNKNLVVVPSYLSKGLEFDSVISYTSKDNLYTDKEKYLYYVVLTRCQHELIIYNNSL